MTRAGPLDLSLHDIESCSQRFWDLNTDPIITVDVGCGNIIGCTINLFIGTLSTLLPDRPDLLPVVQRALRGEVIGNLLLSELGHGLDILNLETTAKNATMDLF